MNPDFKHLNKKDAVTAENDFLKMKMMLERGAQFGGGHPDFSPEMENEFLKSIMAIEAQFDAEKKIKLYDKIDRPTIFKPVAEITVSEIESAVDSILSWLSEYNISVSVDSPNVSLMEFYRFITEELFEFEMDDTGETDWVTAFSYDDFHPDLLYESETVATDDCISLILQKEEVDYWDYFETANIRLNDHFPLSIEKFSELISKFKASYQDICLIDISTISSTQDDSTCKVTGTFSLQLSLLHEKIIKHGKWLVLLNAEDDKYCSINTVEIEGLGL